MPYRPFVGKYVTNMQRNVSTLVYAVLTTNGGEGLARSFSKVCAITQDMHQALVNMDDGWMSSSSSVLADRPHLGFVV